MKDWKKLEINYLPPTIFEINRWEFSWRDPTNNSIFRITDRIALEVLLKELASFDYTLYYRKPKLKDPGITVAEAMERFDEVRDALLDDFKRKPEPEHFIAGEKLEGGDPVYKADDGYIYKIRDEHKEPTHKKIMDSEWLVSKAHDFEIYKKITIWRNFEGIVAYSVDGKWLTAADFIDKKTFPEE